MTKIGGTSAVIGLLLLCIDHARAGGMALSAAVHPAAPYVVLAVTALGAIAAIWEEK